MCSISLSGISFSLYEGKIWILEPKSESDQEFTFKMSNIKGRISIVCSIFLFEYILLFSRVKFGFWDQHSGWVQNLKWYSKSSTEGTHILLVWSVFQIKWVQLLPFSRKSGFWASIEVTQYSESVTQETLISIVFSIPFCIRSERWWYILVLLGTENFYNKENYSYPFEEPLLQHVNRTICSKEEENKKKYFTGYPVFW